MSVTDARRATSIRPTQVPRTVANLVGWFDARKIVGLTDGNAVGTWADAAVTTTRDVTQATAGNKPTYKTAILGSRPVVRFDATNDFLKSATFSTSSPYTIFIVGKLTSLLAAQQRYFDGNVDNQAVIYSNNVDGKISMYSSAAGFASGVTRDTNWHVLVVIFNGASSKIRVDGGAGTAGTTSAIAITAYTLGALGGGSGGNPLNGDLAEVVIYSGALSVASINRVLAYLAAQTAITVTAAS